MYYIEANDRNKNLLMICIPSINIGEKIYLRRLLDTGLIDQTVVGVIKDINNEGGERFFDFDEDFRKEINYEEATGQSSLGGKRWFTYIQGNKKELRTIYLSSKIPVHVIGPYSFSLFQITALESDPVIGSPQKAPNQG